MWRRTYTTTRWAAGEKSLRHITGNATEDFTVECLAEYDLISEVFTRGQVAFVVSVEPKVHAIEKVKTRQVHDWRFVRLLFCAEENRGGKDSLESLDHAAVVGGRPWASERIQGFGRQIRSGSHGCFVSPRG